MIFGEKNTLLEMLTPRENIIKSLRREGFETVPVDFVLCESQIENFRKREGHTDYQSYFGLNHRSFEMKIQKNFSEGRDLYTRESLPLDTKFDEYGIGHSKGSELAFHMTRMHHPLKGADLNEIIDYPYPSVPLNEKEELSQKVSDLHSKGLASFAFMQMTRVWHLTR
jgi:uroporphyrinogen decarboxylase